MHLYQSVADLVGTLDARDLARQLASWHDEMVNHVRAVRLRGLHCEDDCPHERARMLWATALDVFGEHASRLTFLHAHGRGGLASAPDLHA